jgi:hypothetical protein
MSIDYVCNPEKLLVIAVWDGVVSLDQWREHLERMLADPQYAAAKFQLSDLRFSSVDKSFSRAGIQRTIKFMATQPEKISGKKIAMVAGAEWEKPKYVELLLQGIAMRPIVFNDLTRACLWLGVDVVEVGNVIKQIRIDLRCGS